MIYRGILDINAKCSALKAAQIWGAIYFTKQQVYVRSFKMVTPKLVALVMNASRGIGRQIAIDLAKNGYAGTYGQPAH